LGVGAIALSILHLGTRRKWVVNFMPRPLYRRTRYQFDRSWVDTRAGLGAMEKRKIFNPRQESNPTTQIVPINFRDYRP